MNLLQADKDESQANCEKQTKSVLVKVLWNTNMNTIRGEGYQYYITYSGCDWVSYSEEETCCSS